MRTLSILYTQARPVSDIRPHLLLESCELPSEQTHPELPAAALRLDLDKLHVVKEDRSDAIAAINGSPCSQRSDFRGCSRFGGTGAAEEHGRALVDYQQHRAITLLRIDSYMRRA